MGEWFVAWAYPVLGAALLAILSIGFVRRRKRFQEAAPIEDECDAMADQFLRDLRECCAGPNIPVSLGRDYWDAKGWSHDVALHVLRYATYRGKLVLPEYDLGTSAIFGMELPKSAALTQSAYEKYSPREPSMVINGPAHLGEGDQYVGPVNYSWTVVERDISQLALDLHHESLRQVGALAARLDEAAETLSHAVESRNLSSPWVRRSIQWIADLANTSAAGVISAGIIAAATALLSKL